MTAVYIPTPITSAEQAEKLPDWTVATPPDKGGEPMWKCECGYWETDGHDRRNADMIGWTALVAVESGDAAEAVARVFALHAPDEHGDCPECTRGRIYPVPAPCATAVALAGDGA